MRRTSESAACRTTRERCRSEALAEVVREPVRSASAGWVRAAIHAGATPKRMPVTRQSAQAKARTGREGRGVDGDVLVAGECHGEQGVGACISDEQAGDAAQRGENDAFGEELANDAGARGAKGGAEGHFRFAAHAADEEEIGDVGAGDEEDEAGDPHEHVEVGFVLILETLDAAACGSEDDVGFGEGFLAGVRRSRSDRRRRSGGRGC